MGHLERITFYTKRDCPMCDAALSVLKGSDFDYKLVDISGDDGLEGEYGPYIPVVEVDGRIVFHAGMEPDDLINEILPQELAR